MKRFIRVTLFFCAAVLVSACGSDSITPPPPPAFEGQIEIRYASSDVPPAVDSAVKFAVDKWTRALHKNLGDFHLQAAAGECFLGEPKLDEIHHNLLLFVAVLHIDGPHGTLAFTQSCQVSDRDFLPVVSAIRVDEDDVAHLQAEGTLRQVILHEMGHALGFNPKTYMPKSLGRGDPNDPVFIGDAARAEFAKHAAWYTHITVPLENILGTGPADPHWRYSVFGDELMVPVLAPGFKSPLSTITLGLFEDLGYEVDFSVADPYDAISPSVATRGLPAVNLGNDVDQRTPPEFVRPIVTR